MSNLKKVHTEGVGVIYQLFNQVEVYRLMNTLPSYGILVDVYFPKSTNGSVSGLKTTDLKYRRKPTYKDLKVIITNLDNYSQNDTIYESFEEDGFQLKTLIEQGISFPKASKIVVKDHRGLVDGDEELKSFVVVKSFTSKTVINKKIGWKCELTPLYLMTDGVELFTSVKEAILEGTEEIIPDYVDKIEEAKQDIIKDLDVDREELEDVDLIEIDEEGALYNG
jgi:hypothetical protein